MKVTIQDRLATLTDGTEPTILIGETLPPGALTCIQRVVMSNASSNDMWVVIRAESGAGSTVLGMIVCTSDKKFYSWEGPVSLKGVRRIELECNNVNAGDVLSGWSYGYYVE